MTLFNAQSRRLVSPSALVFRLCIVALLLIQITPFRSASGGAAIQTEDPGQAAIYLSGLEAIGDTRGLYRRLHPDAKNLISDKVISGWYNAEFFPLQPQPITEIISVIYVSWTWEVTGKTYDQTAEVTYVQPFGTGANQYFVTETVRLVAADKGEWRWFFGRSKDFVDEQIRIHDPGASASVEPTKAAGRTTRTSTNRPSNTGSSTRQTRSTAPQGATQGCTLVELAPGYPGYRGLVTGLSPQWGGLGDQDCLETLERNNPGFNKIEQDQLNLDAARSLGINGDSSIWLWENWMAIEAQRGLATHCYTCLMFDETLQPINISIQQDWKDPRILAGFVGSRNAIDLYLPTTMMRDNFGDDYQLRAHAFLVNGPGSNAEDVLRIYALIGQGEYWGGFSAGVYIYQTGGYSWVFENAYPKDQIFSVFYALVAATFQLVGPAQGAILAQFDEAQLGWRSELLTGSSERFVDYLRRTTSILDY